MNTIIDGITKEESKVAKKSFLALMESLENQPKEKRGVGFISIELNGEAISIPQKAFYILQETLKNMAEGTSFSLVKAEEIIGTQEAAALLNISRPFFVKLLEAGEIPFSKTGTHRRVYRKDVMAFEKKRKIVRKENLDFLAQQAQKLRLGYE